MSIPQHSVAISQWTRPGEQAADITVWPAHERDDPQVSRDMRGRLSIAIYSGASCTSLRPTAAEARALIDALQWALDQSEATAGVPA